MGTYTLICRDDGVLTIQEALYIEDGFYIEVDGVNIKLYEIPYGGGEPYLVGEFYTILEAIKYSEETC